MLLPSSRFVSYNISSVRIPQPVEKPRQYWFYIYGFNITIVGGLFAVLFGALLGKRIGAMAAMISIVVYTLLVDTEAAVVRADIANPWIVHAIPALRCQI